MRGTITIGQCKTGIIQIGFNSFGFIVGHGEALWSSTADIRFEGKARIGCNPKLRLAGELVFGHEFEAGHDFTLMCQKHINFGTHSLFSWNVTVMDCDGHRVFDENNVEINLPRSIIIGSQTWIGCHVTILKGSILPEGTIVAAHTVVTKEIDEKACIIAGSPCRIIKKNVHTG